MDIMQYENLVKAIAHKRFSFYCLFSDCITLEDCIQSGFLGLCKANKKFNKSKNKPFGNYAAWYIKGEVMQYIFDNLSIVKIDVKNIQKKIKDYIKENGKDDIDIISNYLKVDTELVRNILCIIYGEKMEHPFLKSNKDVNFIIKKSSIKDSSIKIQNEINKLCNPIESKIIMMRFIYGCTGRALSDIFNMTRPDIRKNIKYGIRKLKHSEILKEIYDSI